MKIEAVTVCVGYADFLAETLRHNLAQFDHIVVVTSYEDEETRAVCKRLSVECRPTDVHKVGGDRFAKGRMVDFGLGFLRGDSWICHIDADIYLPPTTKLWLDRAGLDQSCIYGIDRVNCVGWENWQKYIAGAPHHQHGYHYLVFPPPFPLGARLSIYEHSGYLPIGYFQLWHGSVGYRYPLRQGSAEHVDVLHSLQWPRDKRRLLGEVICIHLESEPCRMGANWNGRKTMPFGPPLREQTPGGYGK